MIRKPVQAPLRTISRLSVRRELRAPVAPTTCRASQASKALDTVVAMVAISSTGPCGRPRQLVASSTLSSKKAAAAIA